ncbi:hypothetical protein GJR88_01897 [Dietzia sp. DQ12-45-1b]|nr:hypothetical protein GJR88_01897 [Dietzia sp. DQ12-45-1b]
MVTAWSLSVRTFGSDLGANSDPIGAGKISLRDPDHVIEERNPG